MKNSMTRKLLIIVILYLAITIFLELKNNIFYTNVLNPLIWIGMLIYIFLILKPLHLKGYYEKRYGKNILIISFVYLFLYFSIGSIFGFLNSPYAHNIIDILKNIYIQLIPIFGIEILRNILIDKNKNDIKICFSITLLLVLLELDYHTVVELYPNKELLLKYIFSEIIPAFFYGNLYTLLNIKVSNMFSIIFRVTERLFFIVMPILPDTNCYIEASLGIIIPLVIYMYFGIKVKRNLVNKKKYLIAVILFTIFLTAFMLGFLRFEPITILSNSMSPFFNRGDIVIFKKIKSEEEVKVNSIIVYTVEDKNIAHRVISIKKEKNEIFYQTKGDRNNMVDEGLVKTEQIKGIYSFKIKYAGFPSIWLYNFFGYKQ